MAGVRSAVELPSESLGRSLYDLERVLQGLEAAWAAGSEDTDLASVEAVRDEALLFVPSTVQRVRQVVEWKPIARHITESVRKIAGVLELDSMTDPGAVIGQLQLWGSTLRTILGALPPDNLDVGSIFLGVKLQAGEILRKMTSVTTALDSTESLIRETISALSPLESLVAILNPESVERAKMSELDKVGADSSASPSSPQQTHIRVHVPRCDRRF